MHTSKKLGIKILMVALGALLVVTTVIGCGEEAPQGPIVFADLGWDSALAHNQVAAFILETGYGYPPSEFIPGETIPLFTGLAGGDIDVNMECWVENQQEAYDKYIEAKFTAYGLDDTYNVFLPGSGAALLGSMVAAYEKGEPWFGYYWAPTPALGKYDMTPVAEPAYDEAVWDANFACEFPAVKVNIIVNKEFHDTVDSDVIDFLTAYSTTTAQNNDMLAYMDDADASYKEAAIYFLQNYEDVWTTWVPKDVADKVKAALP